MNERRILVALSSKVRGCSLLIGALLSLHGASWAAKIGLNPLVGDGSPGWTVSISGATFGLSTTYAVKVGGYAVSPSVVSDAAGAIPNTLVFLPALPAGAHDVVLTSATWTHTFTGAFRVRRNICLSPVSGNGKAGQTYSTNASIPAGGWSGMVFRLEGTGFAASATVTADSITVGGAATTHSGIITTYQGLLPTTTVIVTSNLANGRKDLAISDGAATTFYGVYEVRRSIGLEPATGSKNAGTAIRVDGWGFTDGTLGAILIGGKATSQQGAPISVTSGAFSVTVTLDAMVSGGANDVEFVGVEIFTHTYNGVSKGETLAMIPVVLSGVPNEAFQVKGLTNWAAGINANAITLYDLNTLISNTTHSAITVSGGGFAWTWVKATGSLNDGVDRVDATGARTFLNVFSKRTLCICPVLSNGARAFTVSLTGFGFVENSTINANSITIGGTAAGHLAITTGNAVGVYGAFGPSLIYAPLLSNGDKDVGINDGGGSPTTFSGVFHARRSIGLSFVAGPGISGEVTSITGRGFTASSSITANTITFGSAVTHSAIAVAADGSFATTALTLPLLATGAYDVTAVDVFTQAYRVYNPQVAISKHSTPPAAVAGVNVTYSFSYTNAGLGDAKVAGFVLHDTVPTGVQYIAGSATSYELSTVEWYNGASWVGVEPAPASVGRIRWTLSAPMAAGSSGLASFQVTVQ